jgi:hypothetical protein
VLHCRVRSEAVPRCLFPRVRWREGRLRSFNSRHAPAAQQPASACPPTPLLLLIAKKGQGFVVAAWPAFSTPGTRCSNCIAAHGMPSNSPSAGEKEGFAPARTQVDADGQPGAQVLQYYCIARSVTQTSRVRPHHTSSAGSVKSSRCASISSRSPVSGRPRFLHSAFSWYGCMSSNHS